MKMMEMLCVHAGRFTGAGLAHDGHELALFNFHADVVGGFYRGVTHPVIFAHILKFDQSAHCGPPPGAPPPFGPPLPPPP